MTIQFFKFFSRTLLVAYFSGALIYLNVNPAYYVLRYRTIAVIACLIISAALAYMNTEETEIEYSSED